MIKKNILLAILLFWGGSIIGQNTRSADVLNIPSPYDQKGKKSEKKYKKKKKEKSTSKSEVEEFRKRLRRVYKEKAKEEKLANKKQYKKHSHFGHKRPPKKRPPGKQKFCKVCKIKH